MRDRVPPVLVVGAGPAGLATSRELTRRGVGHLVLERGERIGFVWHNLYDSLTLHTGKHLSALPGMPFPSPTPLFPSRREFVEYLTGYAETFRLPIETGCEVTGLRRSDGTWRVRTARGELEARALVVATGIVSNPHVPDFDGRHRFRGRLLHSVEYRRPGPFVGRRVLVIGVGNSAGEISAELAHAGAAVTVAVRSGADAVPRQLLGIPIQYYACAVGLLPRALQRAIVALTGTLAGLRGGRRVLPRPSYSPCPDIPLIGFQLVDAIREGRIPVRGAVRGFTEHGARFDDGAEAPFDDVILATGYRPALGILDDLVRRDECGFALRRQGVVSVDQPDLHFVGQNYDARGALYNIARDARRVARLLAAAR